MTSYSTAASGSPLSSAEQRLPVAAICRAVLLVLFSYVFFANAWLGDDAHITLRVVWNFVNGYGLTFNPDERVQAVTHPLWTLVLAAGHVVTRESYFTPLLISWILGVALVVVLVKWARTATLAAVLIVWLLSSKAFVDYTSSGLEYPLSYLLLALFYAAYLRTPVDVAVTPSALRWFGFIAVLAFLNRADSALLYAIPLAEMTLRGVRAHRGAAVKACLVAALPAIVWLLFATIYYGFPLPNTYYAKVATGIPRVLMFKQGVAYLFNSLAYDPITLGSIALSALMTFSVAGAPRRAAMSALLYVAYTVSVGGDFMGGRFFAMPFLVSVISVIQIVGQRQVAWGAFAVLVLYSLLAPISPFRTTPDYQAQWAWRTQNGVRDERGHTQRVSNVQLYAPLRDLPDHIWAREAVSFRNSPEKATVQGSIGMWGLFAGPDKFIVDRNALSDPLLARLPVSPRLYFEFYSGHFFRDIPEGYVKSVEQDTNVLSDPFLHAFYDRLRNVTRGPIWSWERLGNIWELNLGSYRDLHEQYEKRRPVSLSIRADNIRFLTDVGTRTAGALRTTGRAGYLQYGPGIPMKAGYYQARWLGTVEAAPTGQIGFVEVWSGPDRRIAREQVTLQPGSGELIAQVSFDLRDDAPALEYRLFVNAETVITLERVQLYSNAAIPWNK